MTQHKKIVERRCLGHSLEAPATRAFFKGLASDLQHIGLGPKRTAGASVMYAPMIENTRDVSDTLRSQPFDDAQAEVKVLRSLKTCPEAPRRPQFLCGVNGKMPCKTGPGIKIRTKDRCAANPTAVQLVFVRVHQPQIRPLPYKRRHLAQGVACQQIIMVKKAGPGGINQFQCGIGGTGNVPVFFPQHEAQPFVISGVATQNFRNFTFCGGIISNAEMPVSDEDLEWAVRLALEVRRRVKEQQKRIGAAEFRNTHFSYTMGAEGVEKFVSTPELQSQGGIGDEPLECGQIWTLSPGGQDEHPGLFRLEVTEGPGSGVRVLNNPVPAPFKESIRCAEQNLYARAQQLVGDRDPRSHEFSVQLRGFDAAKSGAKTGIAALIALASALLKKSVRGGLVVAGEVTLGGTIEPIHNAVTLAELAVEKGAKSLLLPVACRRQLFDLSDEMATKLDIEFYQDGRDALLKALAE